MYLSVPSASRGSEVADDRCLVILIPTVRYKKGDFERSIAHRDYLSASGRIVVSAITSARCHARAMYPRDDATPPRFMTVAEVAQYLHVSLAAPRLVAKSAVIMALVATLAAPAFANTLLANCPSTDLQAVIDSANSGDTILIAGTCVGQFVLKDKSITLRRSGKKAAILDGNGVGTVLFVTGEGGPPPRRVS